MLSTELFREQVATVMSILSKTAVVEMCKIIDSSFAEVNREVCLRQSELEVLRTKVRSLTDQARAYTVLSKFPPRRSIAVQVSLGDLTECSTSLEPLAQCQNMMEVIVKVEEDEQRIQNTPGVNSHQSESSTGRHAGLDGPSHLHAPAFPLYRHSSALLPASYGPVKQEWGVSEESHGETTLPNTHLTVHSQDSTSALTRTQGEPAGFGELELKTKQEEKVDQKIPEVPSCSSSHQTRSSLSNLVLPLPSSTSSEPSSSARLTRNTAKATAVTETPTQALGSQHLLYCSSCPKSFWQKAALKRHELSHSDIRLFDCDVCGKSFKMRANLQQHKILHTGKKPFACPYCGKCFSHPSNMKTHQRIHTGERPYLCMTCGQTFNQHTTLTRHQKRRHQEPKTPKQLPQNDDKPFPCHYCKQRFSNMSDRKKHQRIHTGERPYQCSECGLTFNQISHLTRHQKRLHSRNSVH